MAKRKGAEADDGPEDREDKKVSRTVTHWLNELAAAKKRDDDYRKTGRRVREIYAGEKSEATPFNILYSNTETIIPSLYSQSPRPVVRRRYKGEDRIGQAAAAAAEAFLVFALDTNIDGYETFHDAMKGATLDAVLPGRGVTAVKYDADTDGKLLKNEMVCTELKSWDRVLFGYARKWQKCPWIAYEMRVDKKEALRLFGEAKTALIKFAKGEGDEDMDGKPRRRNDNDDRYTGETKTALVYQIWDKDGGRKVRYISPQYTEGYLKEDEDPLELTGFFNTPRPLQFVDRTDTLVPVSLYTLYENQAEELNSLTLRINRLIKAVKARGIYDGELGAEIQKLMDADDNELVPADKSSSLAAEKGLGNAIWFMPLDQIITTLRELYVARENCKQVIYEIMGISDILRGSSKASETLGAQQIKNQWGSLRLKPKQAEVQRYARDLMRLMLEVAVKKFNEDTWAKITGLPFLTQMQAQQKLAVAKAAQAKAMKGDQKAAAQFQQLVQESKQAITWAQVLEVLQNDLQRAYKIDIETNSTVEPEAAEDQKNLTEMMTAMGQLTNGVGPMVLQGAMPFTMMKNLLLAIAKRFRFGDEIEDDIRAMQPPKPPQKEGDQGDGGAAAAAEGKAQKAEVGRAQDKLKAETQLSALQKQLQEAQAVNAAQKREFDLSLRELKVQQQEQMLGVQTAAAKQTIQTQHQAASGKIGLQKKELALSAKAGVMQQQAAAQKAKAASSGKPGGSPSPAPAPAPVETPEPPEAPEMSSDSLDRLASIMEQMMVMQQQVLKAVAAPKVRKAIRGKDGKIEGMIEETKLQ